MRIQTTSLALLSLLSGLPSVTGFDCEHVQVDGVRFDLSPLGGVHDLYHVDRFDEYVVNTTYVLNICNILRGAATRDGHKCGTSKNICGFQTITPLEGSGVETDPFPISGFDHMAGGTKDAEVSLLRKEDPDSEGVRLKLSGGRYREDVRSKYKPAAADIKFICDPERSGLEGLHDIADTEVDESDEKRRRRDEKDDKDDDGGDNNDDNPDNGRSLRFKSFKQVDDSYILRLDWRTKHACENYARDNPQSGGHWGFFTWLIIIVFLCVSAYLIFGSWLNYNRYGARGWDLLPHGDTIRDVPYLFQDWIRRVLGTLQGSGSRGGYSAV